MASTEPVDPIGLNQNGKDVEKNSDVNNNNGNENGMDKSVGNNDMNYIVSIGDVLKSGTNGIESVYSKFESITLDKESVSLLKNDSKSSNMKLTSTPLSDNNGNNSESNNNNNENSVKDNTVSYKSINLGPLNKLVPPLNFAIVEPGIYRSGFPNKRNFEYLKRLDLKSVIYLCSDDLLPENVTFLNDNNINFIHIKSKGNKEPFVRINSKDIQLGLSYILDTRNHPILIHCNRGCHRVGCLIGCLRKLQQWSMPSIFEEYRRFASETIHIADQESIEVFNINPMLQSLKSKNNDNNENENGILFNKDNLPIWFTSHLDSE